MPRGEQPVAPVLEVNPFTETDVLTEAWETLKKQHLEAIAKLSSASAGRRLGSLLRTKIRALQQHCNAEGASDINIEMRNMLRRTY